MAEQGWKLLNFRPATVGMGWKGLEIEDNDQKLFDTPGNGLKELDKGWKWLEMAGNVCKWQQMAGNCWK